MKGRNKTRQIAKKRWEDNIREWTGLGARPVPEGSGEHGKMEETGCEIICGAPTTPGVKGIGKRRRSEDEEELERQQLRVTNKEMNEAPPV